VQDALRADAGAEPAAGAQRRIVQEDERVLAVGELEGGDRARARAGAAGRAPWIELDEAEG